MFFRNPSEVTHINRQRYMAELSKLLAFMFKEDREDILEQYNKLLDEAEDEQALLESFGSPTKLAVTISRTYKRSERKLAVEADSKADKPAAEHLIVTPVKVKKEKEKPQLVDTNLSYADIIEEIRREKAAEEGVEYKPMFFDEPETPAVTAEESPEPETAEEETAAEAAPAEESAEPEQAEEAPAEEAEASEAAEKSETAEGDEQETEEQTEAEEEPAEEAEESSADEETVVEEAAEEETEAEQAEEAPVQDEQPAEDEANEPDEAEEPEEPETEAEIFFEEPESGETAPEATRYKTNAALLILYLIFAIPIGLVLLALSIVLTLTLLGLGVLVIAAGAKLMAFAFSSLVIFADIMLCAGAVLIAFAAALILLWLGILMLVRGIKGVVGGVVSLGRRLCVKEVPVNG